MKHYKEIVDDVINDKDKQDELIQKLLVAIREGGYSGVIVFCGNFLLGINSKDECIPCIPEEFFRDGKVTSQDNLNICKKMDDKKFNTKFSLFSLKAGLELFSKLSIDKQFLLSVDDKYVDGNISKDYLRAGYKTIPSTFRRFLEQYLGGAKGTKGHLKKIVSVLFKKGLDKRNEFMLSERALVNGFGRKKQHKSPGYEEYFENLGKDRASCSLEIFHLLTLLKEQKTQIFENCQVDDKICVVVFIPDACVSSVMQGGLAVSKTDETFEIINVTQTTTIEDGVVMITKITKDGVVRI
ncbi:MAG: hypothetical protein NTY80_03290 [candidate division SR1 bacterium]|nr:hypothetical protein [candidate division SR1 bacterium]